jgi:ribosomal protein S6--L-glutamate ligase
VRIAFFLVRHPERRPSPIFPDVVRLLRKRGADVRVVYPDQQLVELADFAIEYDLYVLKSRTETALSLAGALHALGAAILNPFPVAAMCRDKVVASRVLHRAGIPTPRSYVAARTTDLLPLLEEGPVVVKRYRGSQGRGVRIVRRPSDLEGLDLEGEPVFAERYHEPDGLDWKIYCIGDDVFGVERVWPARTYREKLGKPFPVGNEVRELAFRCGSAFGMSLFGFDVVVSEGEPYVVDISSFPGFKGVPNAAVRLADYIGAVGESPATAEPLLAGLVGPEWVRM